MRGSTRKNPVGRPTTHVLGTMTGRPAAGLRVELWWLDGTPAHVTTVTTDSDGRVPGSILEGAAFRAGLYELRFHAGDYLRPIGAELPDPAFLDVIPVRFGVADADGHYHVPLLLSPYGYSTYRGS